MWVRKRIDIGWSDLANGLLGCFRARQPAALQRQVEQCWSADGAAEGGALACLSVRSGFDLLLGALDLPPQSQVLMTAVTITDMVRIVEEHGLIPVPVDLDLESMGPPLDVLRAAITPQSRAIVVAHLFGGRVPMEPVLELARQHKLLVIEDCAQAFAGGGYRGHPAADASMFSFGPIKTATALAGAVIRVRDPQRLEQMRAQQAAWPRQSRWFYLRRLLKYSVLKFLSDGPLVALVIGGCRATGYDYDRVFNGAVRGFAGPGFLRRIRRQPSDPLLALLLRRLQTYDGRRLPSRTASGRLLVERLAGRVPCPGSKCQGHTHWVFPILADDPPSMVKALREAGFDATQGQSMCVVPPPEGHAAAPRSADALAKIVFLPIYPEMPRQAVEKMAQVVLGASAARRADSAPPLQQHQQAVDKDQRAHHGRADGRGEHGRTADVQRVA